MSVQLTATIIPFPIRNRAPVVTEAPARPVQTNALASSSHRLSEALANLSTALADQKEATRRWKAAIEDLATKMRTVGDLGAEQKKIG